MRVTSTLLISFGARVPVTITVLIIRSRWEHLAPERRHGRRQRPDMGVTAQALHAAQLLQVAVEDCDVHTRAPRHLEG
jgi:hypothetical protein